MGAKLFRVWFDEIDLFMKIYDEITYLVLFATERYNAIFDRINYFSSEKKWYYKWYYIWTFHNVITLIKSVINKTGNNYCYNIFLEKGSYEDKSNIFFLEINACIL